uniref:E2F-associated phosphoprotein n=1 Tax=Arion vulgaris TaxID=1028688 RepID=A0A0B7A202_9EUPU
MAFQASQNYDVYDDDSLSDEDVNTSSEDEIDIILNGTPEQRRKLQHHHRVLSQGRSIREEHNPGVQDANSSSEDEFEKEMNAELSKQVKVLEDSRGTVGRLALEGNQILIPPVSVQNTDQTVDKQQMQTSAAVNEFYDEIYFDSDEEDDTTGSKSSQQQTHTVISNDELLYDPDMDDEDQKWVDRQRQSHRSPASGGSRRGKKLKMPNSDALLDCPACMTTLCIDCQRHATYKHQYRAMFVMNCVTDKSESLQYPVQAPKKRKHKKKVPHVASVSSNENPLSSDLFNPVRCTECNTVVGVVDHDEVYHFFNVLASYT